MYSNICLFKDSQTELLKINNKSLHSIFEQHNPIQSKISFAELIEICKNMSLVPVIVI
jgi:uncharacterized protein YdcH (DUF465 family)